MNLLQLAADGHGFGKLYGGGRDYNEPDPMYYQEGEGRGDGRDGNIDGNGSMLDHNERFSFEHIVTNAALTITYKRI